jgi:hypothetical protein
MAQRLRAVALEGRFAAQLDADMAKDPGAERESVLPAATRAHERAWKEDCCICMLNYTVDKMVPCTSVQSLPHFTCRPYPPPPSS